MTKLDIVIRMENILELDELLREEEDECFDTWLMGGPPDGITLDELAYEVSDQDTYAEWIDLAERLLKYRHSLE